MLVLTLFKAPGGPGVSGNLVDEEGFPRSDIDIHAIRSQRHRLAVLKTDYKTLSAELEKALQAALPPRSNDEDTTPRVSETAPAVTATSLMNSSAQNGSRADSTSAQRQLGSASDHTRVPFALVDSVSPGSPASAAGIQVQDRIVAFAGVSLRTRPTVAAAMQALGATVREHNGRPVDLLVFRNERQSFVCLKLTITPRSWSGNGLLGCHVVPITNPQVDERYRPDVATAVLER